jgi:ribosomal protein S18 acetylase RimI-like enzyme
VKALAQAHSYRFHGGTIRVAVWHGQPDVAAIALRGSDVPSARVVDELLDRLRHDGYREVITNALGPGASVALVDAGFAVRGRLHLLQHALDDIPPRSNRTRRAARGDRAAIVATDAAAFDDFWRFDDLAIREAARATPRAHMRVAPKNRLAGYGLFGRAGPTGYVQRLAVAPESQGEGLGRALLTDGLNWLRTRGARCAFVNTQVDNDRALALYLRAGFTRMAVGLCLMGREL